MTSFLVIGDPHFKKNNASDIEQLVENTLRIAKENQPDYIVCLGDLLDTHEILHIAPLNRAYNFMKELGKLAPTYLLVGNHDTINNQQYLSEHHAFQSFKKIPNLTVVDEVNEIITEEGLFILVPYVPNGRFVEALGTKYEKEEWEEANVIFCHQEFKGCQMGAIISENGDEWDEDWPLIVAGHIHDAQQPQSNIIYMGSALQHAFGESGEKCLGYFTFTDDGYDLEKIPTGLRRKRILYLDIGEVEEFEPEGKDHLKLVISGTTSDFKTFRKGRKFKELQKAGIKMAFAALKLEKLVQKKREPPKDYRKVVQEMIAEEDEYVHELYKEIFD